MVFLIIFILLTFIEIVIALNRRKPGQLEFQFSRYNMFNQKPGSYKIAMQSKFYNLPENKTIYPSFEIRKDGYLDEIKPCDVILCGGSAAFGTGSSGDNANISGILRNEFNLNIVNLAVPGYNLEQEVITLLKHLDELNPKKIVLFDGANNLGFCIPFDYHYYSIGNMANPFYQEIKYGKVVNDHFSKIKNITYHIEILLDEIGSNSLVLRPLYRILEKIVGKLKRGKSQKKLRDEKKQYHDEMNRGVKNYIQWMTILKDICKNRKINLYLFLQPYYIYGRERTETSNSNFYRENVEFDSMILYGYELLDKELQKIEYIQYFPVFKNFATESIDNFVDAVHLNDNGYRIVSKKIFDVIGD